MSFKRYFSTVLVLAVILASCGCVGRTDRVKGAPSDEPVIGQQDRGNGPKAGSVRPGSASALPKSDDADPAPSVPATKGSEPAIGSQPNRQAGSTDNEATSGKNGRAGKTESPAAQSSPGQPAWVQLTLLLVAVLLSGSSVYLILKTKNWPGRSYNSSWYGKTAT